MLSRIALPLTRGAAMSQRAALRGASFSTSAFARTAGLATTRCVASSLRAPATTTSFRSLSTAVATATKTKSSRWLALGAASVLLAYAATTDAERSRFDAKACGIIAHIGDEPAVEYLLEGLHIMQNRGYDSAGIATIDENGKLVVTKYASLHSTSDSIEILKKEAPRRHAGHKVGIAHTRWATHGGKTDENAHPHTDNNNRVAVVHNGTIENCTELRAELEADGVVFASETDTEVIVQMIGRELDVEGTSCIDAVKAVLERLEGTWGLAIICADEPDQIIAARHGSPLCVGIGKGAMFVASEVCAFARHSLNYIALEDGEVAVVKIHDHSLDLSRTEMAVYEKIEMSPAPYAHWTIKEIMEQPESIARALGYGGRFKSDGSVKLGGMDDNAAMLLGVNHLVMAACGTSYFAGLYGAKLMRMLGCFDTVQVFDAAEINRDVYSRDDRGLLVLSQSGETKDTHRAVVQAGERGIPKMSIVNQVGSLIARSTKCGVYLNAGREHAVASTKAFSSQVVACAMVAGWFSQNRTDAEARSQKRREVIDSLHRLPTYLGMSLRTHDAVKDLAKKLYQNKDMFILGKGFAEPIAYEGALKIKELTYIHAEGYSGGALKHGPFALLNDGLPVVLIILDDQHAELMRIAAQEVRARGAFTVVITDKPSLARNVCDEVIVIPSNGPLTALLASIPLQLLAYEMSVLKGINPDKPKNLAKAVTVD